MHHKSRYAYCLGKWRGGSQQHLRGRHLCLHGSLHSSPPSSFLIINISGHTCLKYFGRGFGALVVVLFLVFMGWGEFSYDANVMHSILYVSERFSSAEQAFANYCLNISCLTVLTRDHKNMCWAVVAHAFSPSICRQRRVQARVVLQSLVNFRTARAPQTSWLISTFLVFRMLLRH